MKNLIFLTAAAGIVLLSLLTCSFQKASETMLDFKNDPYAKAWKTIDSLEEKGLPRSALEAVEKIYERAKTDNNPAQQVKSLLYQGKYIQMLEEEGSVKAIQRLQTALDSADFPVRPLLQSILAKSYIGYLEDNQWRLRDRTELQNAGENNNIRFWTIDQLLQRAHDLYTASVQDPRLGRTNLEDFIAIVEMQEDSSAAELRPTLFDFLGHEALDFFTNERSYLNQPANPFVIDDESYLAPAASFVQKKLTTRDTLSSKYQALLLLQELLAFHLKDEDPAALVDADLKRLGFVHQNGQAIPNADKWYLNALELLKDRYSYHEAAAEIAWQEALFYVRRARKYQPNSEHIGKWDYQKAVEILEKAIEQFPDSYGAKNARQLLAEIREKSMRFEMEKVQLPETDFLLSLEYRNLEKVWLRLVPVDQEMMEKIGRADYEQRLSLLQGLKATENWTVDLPQMPDYHSHRLELPVPGQPFGSYLLMVSDNADFTPEKGALAYGFTQVSNLGYWSRQQGDKPLEVFVTDRQRGQPQKGVAVHLYERAYKRSSKTYRWKKLNTQETDESGYAKLPLRQNEQHFVVLEQGKDRLNLEDNYYGRSYWGGYRDRTYEETVFFTDRNIYRPGQTIYFKALLMEKNQKGLPAIIPNESVTVTLFDANYQKVEELKLRANEYGTVQGTFAAPQGGLLGRMHLGSSVGNSRQFFRVEEYKRPKFELVMDPVEGSFKLEETVQVSGLAKAYAGNAISGAEVKYRVVREARFPYWRSWSIWPGWQQGQEITSGTTRTDDKGAFEIEFEAVPDFSIPEKYQPVFNYTVSVDVVDITGETHSTTAFVNVGYTALRLNTDLPEEVDRSDWRGFSVQSQNLNGQFEAAEGKIRIQRLKTPPQLLLDRYWAAPDQFILTEADFRKQFPHHPYREEHKIENWAIDKEIWTGRFETADTNWVSLPTEDWPVGGYRITLSAQDAFGKEIKITEYLQLYDLAEKASPAQQVLFLADDFMQPHEPGGTAEPLLGSAVRPLFVLLEKEEDGAITRREWIKLKDLEQLTFEIQESNRGNFFYHLYAIYQNRSFHTSRTVRVPWSNKELEISYGTFRNKLYPGQEEEWVLTIRGSQKDKVAAEMVATLYDASLDAFGVHSWQARFFPVFGSSQGMRSRGFGREGARLLAESWNSYPGGIRRKYPKLNWFGFYPGQDYRVYDRAVMSVAKSEVYEAAPAAPRNGAPPPEPEGVMLEEAVAADEPEAKSADTTTQGDEDSSREEPVEQPVRTNLDETVFFFPQLQTDEEGNIILRFTMNEALTRWKFLGFAHTRDLQHGFTQNEVVTQKELMVQPNPPRFMREFDAITFTAKVVNMSEQPLSGTARLQLFDAATNEPVDALFELDAAPQSFSLEPGASAPLAWTLQVPAVQKVSALVHRVTAEAGTFSDGEESMLPILTNRMLVTETLPLPVRGGEKKKFRFKRMEEAGQSNTLAHHRFSLEYTSNPAWYAVQALPYLMEYPYECTEQIFNRYYANSLATSAANSHPRIRQVFEQWRQLPEDQGGSTALMSALEKNQELKSALLAETPWVLQAQSEARQKQRIALLFDLNRMADEQQRALTQLAERQRSDGGFSWFPGGPDNWYITQYIVEGLGHLDRLGVQSLKEQPNSQRITDRALQYVDGQIEELYHQLEERVKQGHTTWKDDHLSQIVIHYLYARSFFPEAEMNKELTGIRDYFLGQAETYWTDRNLYQQGMIALALHRYGKTTVTDDILRSLKERSLYKEEMGRYWKTTWGYFWYQMPIETHALMIELFDEVADDAQMVEELKIWLLKNKQTNHWKTTKATASAVYVLLSRGDNWLLEDELVEVKVGGKSLDIDPGQAEAGTGYFKTSWDGEAVSEDMAKITVKNPNKSIAWGAAYWQYFEDLDKITQFEDTPLKLRKSVYRVINTPSGQKLETITEQDPLQPGDELKVRIELEVDRSMEYVHMKDMRASGLEPMNVFSRYHWQGGLGYYQSTRDASTDFFFSYLPKGTHVFEYPLRVVHAGDFSNGITSIQCMYAPEFSSHSEGIRLKVE